MDDRSGEKDRVFSIHSWFRTSSGNLDNELETILQMMVVSSVWEGLQLFQTNMSWPRVQYCHAVERNTKNTLPTKKPQPTNLVPRPLWHSSHLSSSNKPPHPPPWAELDPVLAAAVQETWTSCRCYRVQQRGCWYLWLWLKAVCWRLL